MRLIPKSHQLQPRSRPGRPMANVSANWYSKAYDVNWGLARWIRASLFLYVPVIFLLWVICRPRDGTGYQGYHMLVDDLIHFRSKRWKRCVSVVFVLTPPMCAMVKRWYILELWSSIPKRESWINGYTNPHSWPCINDHTPIWIYNTSFEPKPTIWMVSRASEMPTMGFRAIHGYRHNNIAPCRVVVLWNSGGKN